MHDGSFRLTRALERRRACAGSASGYGAAPLHLPVQYSLLKYSEYMFECTVGGPCY